MTAFGAFQLFTVRQIDPN